MVKFFHKLLHPHCRECREEEHCQNCDTLRSLLEAKTYECQKLIDRIVAPPLTKVEVTETKEESLKPVQAFQSWRVRQQMLEEESRVARKIIDERKANPVKTVEKLEEELGVKNG